MSPQASAKRRHPSPLSGLTMQAAPDASSRFQVGEIRGTTDHIYYPFEMVLGFPSLPKSVSSSLKSVSSTSLRGNLRPCVVMQDDRWEGELSICLMATFGGADLSAMPTVWRHFCVVVDPEDTSTRMLLLSPSSRLSVSDARGTH